MNAKILISLLVIGVIAGVGGAYISDTEQVDNKFTKGTGFDDKSVIKLSFETDNVKPGDSGKESVRLKNEESVAKEPNISVKYVKFIDNTAQMKIDIAHLIPGNYVYVENYYQIDSSDGSKFYSSNRCEIKINGNISFDLYRPNDRFGQTYSTVETIILHNGTINIHWWTDLRQYWN